MGAGFGVFGFLDFSGANVSHAQGRVAEGVVRFELTDLIAVFDGLGMAAKPPEDHRQGRMGQGLFGINC